MNKAEKARTLLEDFDRDISALLSEFKHEVALDLMRVETELRKRTMQLSEAERQAQPMLRQAAMAAPMAAPPSTVRRSARKAKTVMATPVNSQAIETSAVLITPKVDLRKPIPMSKMRVAQEHETLFSINGSPVVVKATPRVANKKASAARSARKK